MTGSLAGQGWAWTAAIALLTWAASVPRRDASLADRVWGLLVAAPAVWVAWQLSPAWGLDSRATWLLLLLLAWALRLSLFLTWRNWGHGEDRRYAAMRQEHGPAFALRSLVTVFGLQATLAWMIGAPVWMALGSDRPLGALDLVGLVIAAAGIGWEAVADAQLARFRADPAHRGQVMDRGLWRYSRHPNYFGETCVWWGFGLCALGAGAPAWLLLSPLLITVLLLRVSGVRLLEQDIAERRPAYREYIARTSAFVPWPPRPRPQPRTPTRHDTSSQTGP